MASEKLDIVSFTSGVYKIKTNLKAADGWAGSIDGNLRKLSGFLQSKTANKLTLVKV